MMESILFSHNKIHWPKASSKCLPEWCERHVNSSLVVYILLVSCYWQMH